jgi:hypothetical protein
MATMKILQQVMGSGWRFLRISILVLILALLLGGAAIPPASLASQVRAFARDYHFDFGTWTLEAVGAKLAGWGLSLERFLTPEAQSQLVLVYLNQVGRVNSLNAEILAVYTNPNIPSPDLYSQPLRIALQNELDYLASLAPLAEAVLQNQLMDILHETGLSFLGQAFPPSLYQVSEIPQNLVISPRTEIRREMDLSLSPGISIDSKVKLEDIIFSELDHAALVVPIGGIGTYPTMVMQSSNLIWLTEVIAHEWVHNFLTLRPLGIMYLASEELRTINETTATLAGQELGWMIMEKYYPDQIPPNMLPPHITTAPAPLETVLDPDVFDFHTEMRLTRIEADRLLADGDVEGAEAYMAARRQVFWDNGYPIRRLNQAYFAFHGAYGGTPGGGAAGEDPVGPAVIALRAQYNQLADFLNAISWVNSYEALLRLLHQPHQ